MTLFFLNPSFFRMWWRCVLMALLDTSRCSAISLVVLPSLIRFATWISFGVRLRIREESFWVKGEMMPLRIDSMVLTCDLSRAPGRRFFSFDR